MRRNVTAICGRGVEVQETKTVVVNVYNLAVLFGGRSIRVCFSFGVWSNVRGGWAALIKMLSVQGESEHLDQSPEQFL